MADPIRYALARDGEVHNWILWDGASSLDVQGYTLVPAAQAGALPVAPQDPYPHLGLAELREVLRNRIKARASELILARAPLWAQINRLARGMDLLLAWHEGSPPSQGEMAELLAGRGLYRDFVTPIRTRSDQLEAQLAGRTRRQLLALAARDWPDSDWPLEP